MQVTSKILSVAGQVRVALVAALFLLAGAAGFALAGDGADTAQADVTVYKTPYCGCCVKWVAQLESAGLDVHTVDVDSTAAVQSELGVPRALRSCHTAKVGKSWVEGHVPPDLVVELLSQPNDDLRGLAVPGMPIGSPGMEGRNPETYEVMRVTGDGKVEVHAVREGRATPPE